MPEGYMCNNCQFYEKNDREYPCNECEYNPALVDHYILREEDSSYESIGHENVTLRDVEKHLDEDDKILYYYLSQFNKKGVE